MLGGISLGSSITMFALIDGDPVHRFVFDTAAISGVGSIVGMLFGGFIAIGRLIREMRNDQREHLIKLEQMRIDSHNQAESRKMASDEAERARRERHHNFANKLQDMQGKIDLYVLEKTEDENEIKSLRSRVAELTKDLEAQRSSILEHSGRIDANTKAVQGMSDSGSFKPVDLEIEIKKKESK